MSFSSQKWQNFSSLSHQICQALKSSGFEKPTKIQGQVLQQYKHYYDFLIASQTGSGKTLAFALPILSQLLQFMRNNSIQQLPHALFGLIITPTRQLAQQIQKNIQQVLCQFDNKISIVSIIGGMSKQKQMRIIRQRKPHIIIGTPGRIHQFLEDQIFNFQYLKYLVIDQADRIIELGHYKQVDQILEKIFRPKVKQFYEKDFLEITQSIAKKDKEKAKQGLYIKNNGKKVKLNFDLHSIQSDKLFQVPIQLFQFINGSIPPNPQNITQEKQIQPINLQPKQIQHIPREYFRQLNESQLFLINKLKRRIFFVSATLTRQFKGQKYKIKRRFDDQEENINNNGKKNKNKNKDKNNKDNKQQDDNDIANIPKLKALLSRVNFSSKPKIIDQSSQLFLPQGLTQKISITQGQNQKISILLCYLNSLPKTSKIIIFSNTIKASRRVQFFIQSLGYKCSNLHSHMQQKMRMTKLQRFKKSQNINILISTDVSARGLDFSVSHVIQYGVPLNGDTYVHRAGRTARANRTGQALIIVDRKQGNKWTEINDILNASVANRKIDKYYPSKLQIDQISKKVTDFQWIRVNNQRKNDLRKHQFDQMQAEQIGIQIQQEQKRKKYDMDKQQQQLVRHQVKRKVQKIKRNTFKPEQTQNNNGIVWKKNKLVLTPEQIMKMI